MKKNFSLEETIEIARCCGEMTQLKTEMVSMLGMYAGFSKSEDVTFSGNPVEQTMVYERIMRYKRLLVKFHETVPKEIQEGLVFLEVDKLVKFGEKFVEFYHGKSIKKSEITFYEVF